MLCRSRFSTLLLTTRRVNSAANSSFFSSGRHKFETILKERTERKQTSLQEKQWTLESIQGKFDRGDINLFPKYQRGFKWKSAEASRLILTVLEERFVPAVVVYQKADYTYDVVDGKQRLSSLLSFFYGSEAKENDLPNVASKLHGLPEDDEELNGLTYELLSVARKRQFNDYSLDVKVIPMDTDDNTVFAVYEDINSGGSKLTHHQLRRAAFYGPYIELIDQLPKDKNFRSILSTDFDESNDGEMILRAFAVCNRAKEFKLPWKRFMNKELIAVRDMNKVDQIRYLEARKAEFQSTMSLAYAVFGRSAFRRYDVTKGEWTNKVDISVLWSSLYSALVTGRQLDLWTDVNLTQNADKFREAIVLAYKNPSFSALFSASRASAKTLHARQRVLEKIIETVSVGRIVLNEDIDEFITPTKGARSFDRSVLQDLFDKQDGKCAHCKQAIHEERLHDGAYAQIDHIIPFSKGGLTEKDNAQLLHAKCNQSKGSKL